MNERNLQTADRRNYGIDLLRLLAMYMVVILHILGGKGALSTATGAASAACWLMETAAFCSVNCFAIISGYVTYTDAEKPQRCAKYASLWLQAAFYSAGITLLFFLFSPGSVGARSLIKAFFPVVNGRYWYLTAYTVVFFIAPWLNRVVSRCEKRLLPVFILLFSACSSLLPEFAQVFGPKDGCGFVWLAILYLTGAWMKKYGLTQTVKSRYALLCALLCMAAAWTLKVFCGRRELINNLSPAILLTAVGLVIVFARLSVGSFVRALVRCFAPAAFGVYLIHLHPDLFSNFLNGRFAWIALQPVWSIPLWVLACAAMVFVPCLLIEKLRLMVFKALKINERAERFCEKTAARLHDLKFAKD